MIEAQNGWVPVYDNVSNIPPWFSNALCSLSTGAGLSVRRIYTDAQEELFAAKRPAILTAVRQVVTQPDLLSRALLLKWKKIGKRETEQQYWARFEKVKPKIFGALLDAVTGALRHLHDPDLRDRPFPRMADFALWGSAVERGLGWKKWSFLKDLNRHLAMGLARVTKVSALVTALDELVEDQWTGTAQDLLGLLNQHVSPATRSKPSWPTNASRLGQLVNDLTEPLELVGLTIKRLPRTPKSGTRPLLIGRVVSQKRGAA